MTSHLLQSTFFALAVGLLTIAFRRNRAQVRYWLWLSASLKFFVPFALLMSLGRSLETWAPAAHRIAAPAISYTVEQFNQPLFIEALPTAPYVSQATNWIPIALPVAWLCGFLTIALIRFRNSLLIRAALRGARASALPPGFCPATVEIRESPGLIEPGVVGFLRPILLLPEGIGERLTPSELGAILAHELCHVRRRDNLFAAIHMIVEAVFWFHPLVWWIGARLVEERERACDEEVLSQGNQPDVYADAILNVCRLYIESPLPCVSGVTGASIKRRIEAIMSNRGTQGLNRTKKFLLAGIGTAALAGPVLIGLAIGVGNAPLVRAQAPSPPAARPKFEVASIHPCDPNAVLPGGRGRAGGGGGGSSPDRVTRNCVTVKTLLQEAYVRFADGKNRSPFGLQMPPIEGAPAWFDSDRYTIEAKADGDSDLPTMLGPMMQSLLEDRFHLKLRRETRNVPGYELTAAKGGSKLKPAVDDGGNCFLDLPPGAVPKGPDGTPLPGVGPNGRFGIPTRPAGVPCNLQLSLIDGPNRLLVARGMALDELLSFLVRVTDHPIVDKTGLTGKFDVRLEFWPDETAPGIPPPPPTDPSTEIPPGATLFTALEQQLGLKLVPVRGTREFMVIEHIEKPSEN